MLKLRRKCVCHISRHSSVVAVLEGIRGALIQTRVVKSVRGLPSRKYYLGMSIGSFVHAADELHHAMLLSRKRERPIPSETEERNTMMLMGTQLRVKNPCTPPTDVSESSRRTIQGSFHSHTRDCCANTLVTL